MSNLEQQLQAFQKTDKFRKLVAEKMKTNPDFGKSSGRELEKLAQQYGDRMREFIRDEIADIKSSTTGESFLDYIIVEKEFKAGTGWVINVSFDEENLHRDSLYPNGYPEGAQLDVLFNEGYDARTYAYGFDRHGEAIYSRKSRGALYFIQRAVAKFNEEFKGKAVAEYNSKYSGGTF